MTLKKLPDMLSGFRIILALFIMFAGYNDVSFYILYVMCGISDVLDGYLARKFNCTHKAGQTIDSIADAVLLIAVVVKLVPRIDINPWLVIWGIVIFMVKMYALSRKNAKWGKGMFIHTYANKITGFALFVTPLLYKLIHINILLLIVCIIATYACIEEIIIVNNSKEHDNDIKSVFLISKNTSENKEKPES